VLDADVKIVVASWDKERYHIRKEEIEETGIISRNMG
jgi:hypothetical protein